MARRGSKRRAGPPPSASPPSAPAPPPPRVASPVGVDRFDLLFLALIVGAGLVANVGPVDTNDIGFHLRLGAEIAASGPPSVDHHSFTLPGVPYPDHEWLAQLGLWGVYRAFDVPGLAVLQGLLIATTLGLVAWATRAPAPLRALATLPVLLLAFDHSEIRPHLLGWIYVAALVPLLDRQRWAAVLGLLWLWANTHASAPLGVGLAGLAVLEELWRTRDRRLVGWGAAMALVPLLNPYGLHVYTLFFTITGNADFVGEWRPYPTDSWQFALLLGFTAFAVVSTIRRRFNVFDLVRLGVLATLSFQSSRSGVVMVIFLGPRILSWFAEDASAWPAWLRRGITVAVTCAVLAVCGQRVASGQGASLALDVRHLPVAAVEFVQRHGLSGPLYNDYNFGGYLLWKAPELPVFVDGRIEVYQGQVLDDHLRISRAEPGWSALLDQYGVNLVLVRPERTLTDALLQDAAWDLVYFDYNTVVFVRAARNPGLRALEVVSPGETGTKPVLGVGSPRSATCSARTRTSSAVTRSWPFCCIERATCPALRPLCTATWSFSPKASTSPRPRS